MKIAYKIRRTTRSDTSSHASDPAPALAAVLARPLLTSCHVGLHAMRHSVYKLINCRHMLIKQHFYSVISAAFNAHTPTHTHMHTHTDTHTQRDAYIHINK